MFIMDLLDKINKLNDIKNIDGDSLDSLAGEIRSFIVGNVSRTGGHLASNLGAVELTMALHLCMDFPEDKLIFDVGHQSYTHKILTGRKDDFYKLRQFGGISGFPKSSESDADAFNTGHSSTSLSAAMGLVAARELRGTDEKICAVIGDGSMTGGMVYEALDQMSELKSNCLVVLNDNEMSISKNVGGLSTSLNKLRVGKTYNELKSNVENALLNIPDVGLKMAKGIKRSKDSIKNLLIPGSMFEEMGITFIGPIDGHNIQEMVKIFKDAFKLNKPVIVHVKTVKGRGYSVAERHPEYFHGVGPFDIDTGKPLSMEKVVTNTDVFARKLIEIGEKNDKLVAITAAMGSGTGIRKFSKRFPDRTFDVGIAEQHAVTFAAGLAKGGFIPVVAIYSSFLQRAYDQMLHDVCLQKLHVIFAIDRSGIVPDDGETHQGIYDTSYLRSMPGLTVIAPKGRRELEAALDYAMTLDGPVAIKYSKGRCYSDSDEKATRFIDGRAEVMNFASTVGSYKGPSIALIGVGDMVETAVNVRDRIKDKTGMTPAVINLRFIKPLDSERIRETAENYDIVVLLEDTVRAGSVGEEISYIITESGARCRFIHFCVKDERLPHGSVTRLKETQGLDENSVYNRISKEMGI